MPVPRLALALAVLAIACAVAQAVEPEPATYDDPDAYAIYSVLLPSWAPGWKAPLPIKNVTADGIVFATNCFYPDKASKKLIAPALADFVEKNKRTWKLQKRFDLSSPYRLMSSDDLKPVPVPPNLWPPLYFTTPSWLEVSAVGFSPDRTIAVVYIAHQCQNLCGGGEVSALQKKNGGWVPFRWLQCQWHS